MHSLEKGIIHDMQCKNDAARRPDLYLVFFQTIIKATLFENQVSQVTIAYLRRRTCKGVIGDECRLVFQHGQQHSPQAH